MQGISESGQPAMLQRTYFTTVINWLNVVPNGNNAFHRSRPRHARMKYN